MRAMKKAVRTKNIFRKIKKIECSVIINVMTEPLTKESMPYPSWRALEVSHK